MSNNAESQDKAQAMADEAARQDREKILKHFKKIVRGAEKTEFECREEKFEKQRKLEELNETVDAAPEAIDAAETELAGCNVRHKNSLVCLRQFRKRLRLVQEMEI